MPETLKDCEHCGTPFDPKEFENGRHDCEGSRAEWERNVETRLEEVESELDNIRRGLRLLQNGGDDY